MTKAWNDKEKAQIKETLRVEGRKLFEKFGLRKTTVDDIVRASGISKGAYYAFYPSKEMLFFDITSAIQLENRKKFYAYISVQKGKLRERFKQLLDHALEVLAGIPLYQKMNPADYMYLMRKLPEETKKIDMDHYLDEFLGYFNPWIKKGWMRKMEPQALKGVFMSFFYLVLHRADFDETAYQSVKNVWIDMLSEYLITSDKVQ